MANKGRTGIMTICEKFIHLNEGGRVLRSQFEAWVDKHDKRDWCNDEPDHRGEHEQKTGTFTWGEYYNDHLAYAEADLYEYQQEVKASTARVFNRMADKQRMLASFRQVVMGGAMA